MKMLFIGDVVGKSGRRALRRFLPELQDETEADLTVVNAENAAGGFGVTAGVLEELLEQSEIDVLTSGNHIWDKREALDLIQDEPRLLRPHNYPEGTPGSGWTVATATTCCPGNDTVSDGGNAGGVVGREHLRMGRRQDESDKGRSNLHCGRGQTAGLQRCNYVDHCPF